MEKYDYIEDVILKVDDGKIIKKKKSLIMPVGLLIVGAVVLYFGGQIDSAKNDILSSLIIILGLGILVWGVVAFIVNKEHYIYQPTGKALKKHKVYVAPNQSFKLHQILDENNYEELGGINQSAQSNLSLEIYCTDDREYALLQALEFIPYNDVPTSPVKICKGEHARKLATILG